MAQATAPIADAPRARFVIPTAWLLVAIAGLGLALRLWAIGHQSLWLDEATSVFVARGSLPDVVRFSVTHDTHPPLYHALLHFWVYLGDSETMVRLPSALLGAGCIVAMYALASALYDVRTGLIAALIVAVSPFLVWYSQETRMYALVLFLVLTSAWALVRATQTADRRWWLLYVAATICALYTDNGAIFYVVATNLWFLLHGRREPYARDWLLAQAAVVALYAPWLPVLFVQSERVAGDFWIDAPTIGTVLDVFRSFDSFHFPLKALNLAYVGVLFLWVHLQSRGEDRRRDLLICWLFVPIVLSLLASIRQPVFLLRNLTPACIGFYLLIALGLSRIRDARLLAAALLPLLLMNAVSLHHDYTDEPKEDWRGAVAYVRSHAAETDLVLLVPNYTEVPFTYYARGNPPTRGYASDHYLVHKKRESTRDLEAATKGYSAVWLVIGTSHTDANGSAETWLNENARLVDSEELFKVTVLKYALPSDTALVPR